MNGITKNQTPQLLQRFERDFSSETKAIGTLRKVVLMTPENTLNAFMYEPILDMSGDPRTLFGCAKSEMKIGPKGAASGSDLTVP